MLRERPAPFSGIPSEPPVRAAIRSSFRKHAAYLSRKSRFEIRRGITLIVSSSCALRRGVVRAIVLEVLRVSRAPSAIALRLKLALSLEKIARLNLTLLFSAKYFLLHCLNCAMLLKIFSRSRRKFSGIARKKGFHSFGSPNESRIRRRITPTVESPAATRRALCLLL